MASGVYKGKVIPDGKSGCRDKLGLRDEDTFRVSHRLPSEVGRSVRPGSGVLNRSVHG